MKRNPTTTMFFAFALAAFFLLGSVSIVGAQEQQSRTQPASQQAWSADQINNLVAPIALYPDPLLSQILVASTYPLEVVEASQWLQQNKNLRGQAAIDAARQQPWDSSVQALVAVPDALGKLNEDIRWTTDLGNVFLSQEADVMSAVQRMRARAQANGRLATTQQQTVTTQEQDGQQAIVIQPADPEVIYVPVYDPSYIWGPPFYGYYPALYYPTFGFGFGIGYDLGFCFVDWRGWGLWGWGPNWFGHTVFMNSYFFNHYGYYPRWAGDSRGRTAWSHNPAHRLHVPYGNDRVAARFGGRSTGFRDSNRAGGGPRSAGLPYANRSDGRFAGSNTGQGYRGGPPQTQRYQNAPRQRYQSSQQYREGSRVMSLGSQRQERFQAQQQFRSAPQISAPRSGGGSFNRGGGFSGGGGSFSRGGGNRHR